MDYPYKYKEGPRVILQRHIDNRRFFIRIMKEYTTGKRKRLPWSYRPFMSGLYFFLNGTQDTAWLCSDRDNGAMARAFLRDQAENENLICSLVDLKRPRKKHRIAVTEYFLQGVNLMIYYSRIDGESYLKHTDLAYLM